MESLSRAVLWWRFSKRFADFTELGLVAFHGTWFGKGKNRHSEAFPCCQWFIPSKRESTQAHNSHNRLVRFHTNTTTTSCPKSAPGRRHLFGGGGSEFQAFHPTSNTTTCQRVPDSECNIMQPIVSFSLMNVALQKTKLAHILCPYS